MKLLALCVIAMLLVATVDAHRPVSKSARKHLKIAKRNLERKYGPGLGAIRAAHERNYYKGEIVDWNGFQFDTSGWDAFIYGYVLKLQFAEDSFGNCFYQSVESVGQIQNYAQDVIDLVENGEFFNLIFLDPIHTFSNGFAAYEYCNAQKYLDIVGGFTSLSFPDIGQSCMRMIVGLATTVPAKAEEFKNAELNGDQFSMGKIFEEIWVIFFDVKTES